MPVTSGPASKMPARTGPSLDKVKGTPADTVPQAKAHMGANQVMGFNSSRAVAGVGQDERERSGVASTVMQEC